MSMQKVNVLVPPFRSAPPVAARDDARSRGELTAMARRYESTQPEFAEDLYAAARNDRQI